MIAIEVLKDTQARILADSYVISTKIDKSTADRPHFFLAYGTKDRAGLKAFRQTEYDALRGHAKTPQTQRSASVKRALKQWTCSLELTLPFRRPVSISWSMEQKKLAADQLFKMVSGGGAMKFPNVVDTLLEAYMFRETER